MNRFDCHEALSALLDEWLDPSLDAARRQDVQREVERVVAACPEGEREWRGLLELGTTMRALPPTLVPPRVRSNISAALHARPARRARFWSFGGLAWLGSASLAAFVLWTVVKPESVPPYSAPLSSESAPMSRAPSSAAAPLVMPPKPGARAKVNAQAAPTKGLTLQDKKAARKATEPQAFALQKSGIAREALPKASIAKPQLQESESESDLEPALSPNAQRPTQGQPSRAVDSKRKVAAAPRSQPSFSPPSPALSLPAQPEVGAALKSRSSTHADTSSEARLALPRIAIPSIKPAAPPAKKSFRLRVGTPDAPLDGTDLRRDFKTDWAKSEVTFTVVTLPSNTGTIVAPPSPREDSSVTPALPSVGSARARFSAPALPATIVPGVEKSRNGNEPSPRDAVPSAPAAPQMRGENGPAAAPKVGGFGSPAGGRVGLPTVPPAIAPGVSSPGGVLAPTASPLRRDNGASEEAKVFTVPPPTLRRFRVTIQAPRLLGRARVRLEGSNPAVSKGGPVWQGIIEEQKPVTFDLDAAVNPGDHLNLVLEQIRPNGESGERKVFPLLRP